MRFNLFADASIQVADEWDVLPSILFMSQGKYKELSFGGMAKYTLVDSRGVYRALYGGFWYRNKDAGFLRVGMDYDQWNVGISYDVNFSDLVPASNYRGSFEVSVIYIIKKYHPEQVLHRSCPIYL